MESGAAGGGTEIAGGAGDWRERFYRYATHFSQQRKQTRIRLMGSERPDGTAQLFLGNGTGNGKIYELSNAQLSDDGAAISSYYTTYFLPSMDDESSLQTRAHRKLFSYLTCYVEGAGNLNLMAFTGNEAFPAALVPLALSSPAPKDLELPINVLGERVAFQVGTNQPGSWFRLSRLVVSLMPDPWAPVRGGN